MRGAYIALTLGALLTAPLSAQVTSDHIFIPMIQRGDLATAKTLIDGRIEVMPEMRKQLGRRFFTVEEFFERVKPCYFRMAFKKTDTPDDVEAGVWMCSLTPTASNPNLSRTILVQIEYKGERVSINSYSEFESPKPAPAPGT